VSFDEFGAVHRLGIEFLHPKGTYPPWPTTIGLPEVMKICVLGPRERAENNV
jgi:hypothetical protein